MTKEELDNHLLILVENRFKAAYEKKRTFSVCRRIFDNMVAQGYAKEMDCFQNLVLYTIMFHPDWTEEQVLKDIVKSMG